MRSGLAALLLCVSVAYGPARAGDAEKAELQKAIDAFSKTLAQQLEKDKALADDGDVSAKLRDLRDTIMKVNCGLNPAQRACQIEQLSKLVDAWKGAFDVPTYLLLPPEEKARLAEALASVVNKLIQVEQAAPTVRLKNALTHATSAVDGAAGLDMTALQSQISNLRTALTKLECAVPDSVGCKINRIASGSKQLVAPFDTTDGKDGLNKPQTKALTAEIVTPLNDLIAIEMLNPNVAVTNGITRLLAAITAAKPIDPTDAALATNIKTLRDTLDGLTALPRINIVGAWFGDIQDISYAVGHYGPEKIVADGRRFCMATQAVRTLCQAKHYCYETPNAETSETPAKLNAMITGLGAVTIGDKLCGYDPAPYADKSIKGLIVAYQCLEESDAYWKDQTGTPPLVIWPPQATSPPASDSKSPGYRPPSATAPSPTDKTSIEKVYGTLMRVSAIGDIRCYRKALPQ